MFGLSKPSPSCLHFHTTSLIQISYSVTQSASGIHPPSWRIPILKSYIRQEVSLILQLFKGAIKYGHEDMKSAGSISSPATVGLLLDIIPGQRT